MQKCFFYPAVLLVSIFINSEAYAQQGKVVQTNIKSKARYVSKGRYDWKVYINADASVLKTITYVEYTLHPTYPKPVNKMTNYSNRFLYENNGWGEFYITVKVVYKNKSQSSFKYFLKLKDDKTYSKLD